MGRCKDCKFWVQNYDTLEFYNENFGECTHQKVTDVANIKVDYNDKKHERYNKYDVLYTCDEISEIRMNKEFGCINFEEKVI